MPLTVTSGPAVEPVTADELKTHDRVSTTSETAYLNSLITIARINIEQLVSRALINQTIELTFDRFPSGRVIELERSPVSSISSLQYLTGGSYATYSAANYSLSKTSPARLVLKTGYSWPDIDTEPDAVKVTYVAGYGANAASVPAPLIHAVKFLATHLYEHRSPVLSGPGVSAIEIPMGIQTLALPYKVHRRL